MVTVNWIINAHKILVTRIVLAMMWYFHNWSAAACALGIHRSPGAEKETVS